MNGRLFGSARNKGKGFFLKAAAVFAALILFLSADETTAVFINKTPWQVHIVAGSGRSDICSIAPHGQAEVKKMPALDETYYPLFDIPLTESFSLKNLRAANRDFYFRLDGSRKNQRIEITAPEAFNDSGASILLTNASRSGGISLSRNDSLYRMIPHSAVNNTDVVNTGETAVYLFNPAEINSFTLRPHDISSGPMSFQRGMLYQFLFDGASIVMTDKRPLVRAGERGWTKIITEADTALQLARNAADRITVFLSGRDMGIETRVFLSDGELSKTMRQKLPDCSITGVLRTNSEGLIVSGYIENGSTGFLPVLRRQREDGSPDGELEPSRQQDRRSAYFLAAAENGDSELLAVGGADSNINSTASYKAYIRALRETPAGFVSLWELGPAEFDAAAKSALRYGEVSSAIFDRNRGTWVITGKNIEYDTMRNPVTGSYIARINRAGKILQIDASYKNFIFNRICIDTAGYCYLAGEEEGFGASYAVTLKLAPDGTEVWRSRNRPDADSFYQDIIFDGDNNQIVLAGTLRAADRGGTSGTPFIEGIHAETGELIWRQMLTDNPFRGTTLVTGIEKAPFYGFVLALSGVKDGYFAPPFMIARVNTRGKL
jgi:hypothetical protein